jgi:phage N-6-adenine-methyltransferase
MSMPKQKPGCSKQDYGTPPELLHVVRNRLHIKDFDLDIAATKENAVCPYYYSLEEGKDAFLNSWQTPEPESGWAWLNPPFGSIKRWIQKAVTEASEGANIIMLIPASVGAKWWAEYVEPHAYVCFLQGRISFIPTGVEGWIHEQGKFVYPKDCALLLYTPWGFKGNEVWNWRAE